LGTKLVAAPLFATMIGGGMSLAMLPRQSAAPAPPTRAVQQEMTASATQVAVVDGATLLLGSHVVRLFGALPPPRGEACGATDCATAATNALAALVRDVPVTCRLTAEDADSRPYGVCQGGGVELNRAVISAGWARADSAALRPAEAEARSGRRGLWAQK
jgi:endonuclease YncB( thermonuclease family)